MNDTLNGTLLWHPLPDTLPTVIQNVLLNGTKPTSTTNATEQPLSALLLAATTTSSLAILSSPPSTNVSDLIFQQCSLPWSYVSSRLLRVLWRLIYWTAFFLNWWILPVLQSMADVGDFTNQKRLKSALVHRITYYRNMFIVSVIGFVYYAVKFGVDTHNIVPICISISNTFSLIIMLPLLGYGLVDLPRKFYYKSLYKRRLDFLYFKAAKANEDKCLTEQNLDEALAKVEKAYLSIEDSHLLRPYVHIILSRVSQDFVQKLTKSTPIQRSNQRSFMSEEDLALIHAEVKKCVFDHSRAVRQWESYVNKAIEWEDVRMNLESPDRIFKSSFTNTYTSERYSSVLYKKYIYTPKVQWWWKCVLRPYCYRYIGFGFAIFSAIIIWSEFTFVIRKEPLSLFELLFQFASAHHQYFLIELMTLITLVYLFSCTFNALFKIRLYDYFYLAPNQQTSESSLAMSGM